LLIARHEYPRLKTAPYLALLKEMGGEVFHRTAPCNSPEKKLEKLNEFFFGDLGFKANEKDYYDPQNSYLSDVMDRRLGIPITMSVVYLELGWMAELPLVGINFPGRFLVAWKQSTADVRRNIYVDVFDGGKTLDQASLKKILRRYLPDDVKFEPLRHLRTAGIKDILHRILLNLKSIHSDRGQVERALWTAEWMVKLKPGDMDSVRDLGVFCYSLGKKEEAETALSLYLENAEKSPDYSQIWQLLQSIKAQHPTNLN
jgi:regulator of sirC expression with transglutaminase-like and TPR domain